MILSCFHTRIRARLLRHHENEETNVIQLASTGSSKGAADGSAEREQVSSCSLILVSTASMATAGKADEMCMERCC